jgi:hypothetical protein
MAICNALSAGLDKSCDRNAGGVNRLWVGDFTTFVPTITSGEITTLTPTDPNIVITTGATVNSDTAGPTRDLTTVVVPGNQTTQLASGTWFYFTYNVKSFDGLTITATYWSGYVLVSTYDTVNDVTVITPDFGGFTPIVGRTIHPAPTNTNQTVSTYAFFEVKTNKNVCNFTETVAVDMANGTTFFNQVVTMVLSRRETTKRTFIEKLVDGQKQLSVVVLDTNGIYWLFGLAEGSYVTGIEGGTGTAKADMNGYTVTFTAMEPEQAYELNVSAITPYLV